MSHFLDTLHDSERGCAQEDLRPTAEELIVQKRKIFGLSRAVHNSLWLSWIPMRRFKAHGRLPVSEKVNA